MVDEKIDTSKGGIPLADGWFRFSSKKIPGKYYYFNKTNGESSWTSPFKNHSGPPLAINDGGVSKRKRKINKKAVLNPRSRAAKRDSLNASVSAISPSAAKALSESPAPRARVGRSKNAPKMLNQSNDQQKVEPVPTSNSTLFGEKLNKSLPVQLKRKGAAVKRPGDRLNIQRTSSPSTTDLLSVKKQKIEHCMTDDQNEMVCEPYESKLLTLGSSAVDSEPPLDGVHLVVDTNVFMYDIDLIKDLAQSQSEYKVVVPWTVIKELDGLKTNKNNRHMASKARAAIDYLYKNIPTNTKHIKVQPLRDFSKHIHKCDNADDEIMNCVLQHTEKGVNVVLVTNDKNLSVKAAANEIKSMAVDELKIITNALCSVGAKPRDNFKEVYEKWCTCLNTLLSNLLENEMKAKYDTLWHKIVLKSPPWTLKDCLQCIKKHWISVFSEILLRKGDSVNDLLQVLNTIETSKVLNSVRMISFRRHATDIVTACQIIPEYSDLASQVMPELMQPLEKDLTNDDVFAFFENMWNILSSYGAKLANLCDVVHNFEGNLYESFTKECIEDIFYVRFSQVQAITFGLKRYIQPEDQFCRERQVDAMLKILSDIIAEGESEVPPTRVQFRTFCLNRSDLLEKAFDKFNILLKTLVFCQVRMLTSD